MVDNIIKVDFETAEVTRPEPAIDLTKVRESRRSLQAGLIAPAVEDTSYELAGEHAADPIKSVEDIERVSEWFIGQGKYRDNMLFIVGINFGLRISDLLTLRFSHLIDDQFRFKTTFPILEKKTKNTRKVKKNRYITINDAVVDAVTLYLEHTPGVKLSDYMFRSESNNSKKFNKPLNRSSPYKTFMECAAALDLPVHFSTHALRKTFAYHQMLVSNNDPRKLMILQKMFGHRSVAQTLDYIGITDEEIEAAYLSMNLGGSRRYNHYVPEILEA